MPDLDQVFDEVQLIEATVQKAIGEKSALTRQLETYKAELAKDEQECIEKFGCNLSELELKKTTLEAEIIELFNDLKEKAKQLD